MSGGVEAAIEGGLGLGLEVQSDGEGELRGHRSGWLLYGKRGPGQGPAVEAMAAPL